MKNAPMPWRIAMEGGALLLGRLREFEYGCYFPSSDVNVNEAGHVGTGKPEGVEWLAIPEGKCP